MSVRGVVIQVDREIPEPEALPSVELAGRRAIEALGVTVAGDLTITEIGDLDPEWQDFVTDKYRAYRVTAPGAS